MTVNGEVVKETIEAKTDSAEGGATVFRHGSLSWFLKKIETDVAIRLKDSLSPVLKVRRFLFFFFFFLFFSSFIFLFFFFKHKIPTTKIGFQRVEIFPNRSQISSLCTLHPFS